MILPRPFRSRLKPFALLLVASAATLSLAACASTSPTTTGSIGPAAASGQPPPGMLDALAARYKKDPDNKNNVISYAAALRGNGQAEQAVAVLENGIAKHNPDAEVNVAYAKALAAAGRFEQALNIIEQAIDPASPTWNALNVKGAILDQSGDNNEARLIYGQALKIAPNEPTIHANLGLSYAMTNELDKAEAELRTAASLPSATSQIRQNLALVIGLEGRFDEAHNLFAAELPPAQVESNMAYIRSLLTQQNRWDLIKKQG